MLTVIIGGARSGKSRFGQNLRSGAERVAYADPLPAPRLTAMGGMQFEF